MRASLHLLLWTASVCAISSVGDASAQSAAGPSPPPVVSGTCPDPSAVESALSTLFPVVASGPSGPRPTVSDLGDRYSVAVGDRSKTYADPGRDCPERARVVATFIALVLGPEAQPAASAPPAVAPPNPPPSPATLPPAARVSAPSRARWLRVDARGALELGSQGQVAPGAILRVAAGWEALGAHAVCGWLAGAPIQVPGAPGSVLIERFPCAVGPTLRLVPDGRRLELEVDAGLAVGALRASGRGFAVSYESTHVEAGLRVAVDGAIHIGLHPGAFSPVVGLELTYYPSVYDLDVMPRGVVAQTPYLWGGVTGGVCWTGGL